MALELCRGPLLPEFERLFGLDPWFVAPGMAGNVTPLMLVIPGPYSKVCDWHDDPQPYIVVVTTGLTLGVSIRDEVTAANRFNPMET